MCLSRCCSQTNSVKEESASEADFAIVAILDASVAATSQLHMFQPYHSEKLVVLFVSFFFSIKVIVSLASHFANSLVVCKVCLSYTGTLTFPHTALFHTSPFYCFWSVCVCVRVRKSTHVINV